MGSPPSYYSTSQKPTELWNKQVSMGGLSPHPTTKVPWSLHSNESNLALHETFLLPNENPVLSPFLMMFSCPLQAENTIMDFSLTCSSYDKGHKRCFPSDPWARAPKALHLGKCRDQSLVQMSWEEGWGSREFLPGLRRLPHSLFFLTHVKLDQMPDLGSERKLIQVQLQWPLCK